MLYDYFCSRFFQRAVSSRTVKVSATVNKRPLTQPETVDTYRYAWEYTNALCASYAGRAKINQVIPYTSKPETAPMRSPGRVPG